MPTSKKSHYDDAPIEDYNGRDDGLYGISILKLQNIGTIVPDKNGRLGIAEAAMAMIGKDIDKNTFTGGTIVDAYEFNVDGVRYGIDVDISVPKH